MLLVVLHSMLDGKFKELYYYIQGNWTSHRLHTATSVVIIKIHLNLNGLSPIEYSYNNIAYLLALNSFPVYAMERNPVKFSQTPPYTPYAFLQIPPHSGRG